MGAGGLCVCKAENRYNLINSRTPDCINVAFTVKITIFFALTGEKQMTLTRKRREQLLFRSVIEQERIKTGEMVRMEHELKSSSTMAPIVNVS